MKVPGLGDCGRWQSSLRSGPQDDQSGRREEIHLGCAMSIYGAWKTCRQEHMKFRREVKAGPRDPEVSTRLSGCDKLRHWPSGQNCKDSVQRQAKG